MIQSDLSAVAPFNCLWCPVILLVVNICPFRLFTVSVALYSGRQMYAVLLLELFVGQVFSRRLGCD